MSKRRPSLARKKTIKARARKTNKRNRRGVVQTNETERNGAREDQLKLASLSSGVEVALLVSASIDWGKSVLISSRAASPSSVCSFVRRAAREPTGRNGTATDARGGARCEPHGVPRRRAPHVVDVVDVDVRSVGRSSRDGTTIPGCSSEERAPACGRGEKKERTERVSCIV